MDNLGLIKPERQLHLGSSAASSLSGWQGLEASLPSTFSMRNSNERKIRESSSLSRGFTKRVDVIGRVHSNYNKRCSMISGRNSCTLEAAFRIG